MVQAMENRSLVWCAPGSRPEEGPAPGWCTVPVSVERTEPVGEVAHLMTDAAGDEYTALVPPELVERLSGEPSWVVEVEVTGPRRITVRSVADEGPPAD
ncbi:hypothetical protein N5P18_12805 [Janibacter terrae]|jgi:hypothetical protein|uniref:DUF1905 domain-containing protein n=1 Tax=Janibacter terrae TaxID=103817 RepID=A0ABZ2FB77_9MICO|nr:hypothetical protein [Janibacter terrae]MBA4085365.1 hypothetical protein [Kytococcus sp.]HBO54400.1 hypothetical protein [Janibacter terrae]HCE60526.1 hypothetical protein [Janibacter terrae]